MCGHGRLDGTDGRIVLASGLRAGSREGAVAPDVSPHEHCLPASIGIKFGRDGFHRLPIHFSPAQSAKGGAFWDAVERVPTGFYSGSRGRTPRRFEGIRLFTSAATFDSTIIGPLHWRSLDPHEDGSTDISGARSQCP